METVGSGFLHYGPMFGFWEMRLGRIGRKKTSAGAREGCWPDLWKATALSPPVQCKCKGQTLEHQLPTEKPATSPLSAAS